VKKPCIALDTDFRIDELNGFPRAFVNFSLETIGVEGMLKLMEGKANRRNIDGSIQAMQEFANWYESENI